MKTIAAKKPPQARPRRFRESDITFEEFVDLIPDGQKADLIEGVIWISSPELVVANELTTWLAVLLHSFVESRDLGKVYMAKVVYRLDLKNGRHSSQMQWKVVGAGTISTARRHSQSKSSAPIASSATTWTSVRSTRKPA